MRSRITRSAAGLALAAGLLLVGACGSADDVGTSATTVATTVAATTAATATPTFPATIDAANGAVVIEARPAKIVSLSPTATEMLFAIGAGPQVVAVDDQSTYPPEAPLTDLSGYQPNIEAIAGYEPDLVIAANDTDGLLDGLQALDVPALLMPAAATIDDTYVQLEQLGAATGHPDEASTVVAGMQRDIEAITAALPPRAEQATYYHELDDTYYTATSSTFIGSIYALAGLVNIGDAADKDSSGYPQLSAEYIVQEDPDLIFLADTKCCGQNAETVAARPGWGNLSAVRNGLVVGLDDDIASRWGPRIVEYLQTVADAVAKVPAA
jgi:iron complex transport system substrate-binding protein